MIKINSQENNEIDESIDISGRDDIEAATTTSKLNVFCWAMYDLANTIYSMVIVSLLINRYVLIIGQLEHGLTYGEVSFLYGLIIGIMNFIVAICIPIIGAFSDNAGKRKPFVISLTFVIVLFAGLIGLFRNIPMVLLFFIIANVAYQFSLAFYDAMLPFIASKKDVGKVAGFGVAWGYFGTIISLFILLPLIASFGDMVSDPSQGSLTYGYSGEWITWVLPMILFVGFAVPFFFVREKQKKGKLPPIGKLVKGAFSQLKRTFKDIRKHKPMFIFIIGYFFIADIASVLVLYMTTLVTDGLIIGQGGVANDTFAIIFIIIATFSAVIFTYFIGLFGNKFGGKKTFYLVGAFWAVSLTIAVILIFVTPYIDIGLNLPFIMAIVVGVLAGPALGGTWTAQRIMVTDIAPIDKFGEYFGFTELSGKISSAIGPIVFGSILLLTDVIGKAAYGWAIIASGLIMGIGILIISFVKAERSDQYIDADLTK